MNRDRIEMSYRERDRVKVMASVLEGQRTQREAARLLKLSVRQARRIQRRIEAEGDVGVIHRQRGQPSHRAKNASVRQAVLSAYRQSYADFGPTLSAEKLAERGWVIDHETLRRWLLDEGLWQRRRQRDKHRKRRQRRECLGELIQADGSLHDWLEGRGPAMVLLVMIDDATSKVMARFFPAETTEGYMDLLERWIRKHGRPVAMYTDRHSVFWGQAQGKQPAQTQFTRALRELEIEWIPAYSPQAKGRVERFNGTAQDRLVKELRLAGACTIEQANEVLEEKFLPWFNRWRTVAPISGNNAHRPRHASMDLAAILSLQERRKVANDYTIQLDGQVYQLLKPAWPGERGGWVVVEKRRDGTMRIRFKGRYLAYHQIGPSARPGALPPNPRSSSPGQTPAETVNNEGPAVVATGPSAVRLAPGRSGRTPAEPCLPTGEDTIANTPPYRPPADHPWRGFRLRGSPPKRTFQSSPTTGHS